MDPRLQQAKRETAKKHKDLFDRAYIRVKTQLQEQNRNRDKTVTGTCVCAPSWIRMFLHAAACDKRHIFHGGNGITYRMIYYMILKHLIYVHIYKAAIIILSHTRTHIHTHTSGG